MPITLDLITNVNADRDNSAVYTDLKLDLTLNSTYNNELNKQLQITDVQVDNNLSAIYNSITSIITTTPGQKVLNPVFGINFKDLLFLPVTKDRGQIVGNSIFANIQKFEPRVTVTNINVTPDVTNQQYIISLNITVPRFSSDQVQVTGVLDKAGFYFNN